MFLAPGMAQRCFVQLRPRPEEDSPRKSMFDGILAADFALGGRNLANLVFALRVAKSAPGLILVHLALSHMVWKTRLFAGCC